MEDLRGKVVLAVNVASKCGFVGQYNGLEDLYKRYADKGFIILGFPCNQFGWQEPGSDDDVASFCKMKYDVSFPIMKKSDVNGPNTNSIYAWLKQQKSGRFGLTGIKWNFEKFLIGKDGVVINRYSTLATPSELEKDIEKAVNA